MLQIISVKKLRQGKHFSIKYSNNKKVGLSTVTVTGKGAYHGQKKETFKIVPKGTSLRSVKANGSSEISVKWRKQSSQTSGYQIRYSTSSKMKDAKTINVTPSKKTSTKIGQLKGSTKYYFSVRTYRIVDGKTFYSSWSKKKNATTKRAKEYIWVKKGTGTSYYANFPAGFERQREPGATIFNKYNRAALNSYEKASAKRVVTTNQNGWVYWHWTHNKYKIPSGNYNVTIEDRYCWNAAHTVEYYNFRAFESKDSYGEYDPNGKHDPVPGLCFYHWRNIPEDGSWWWFRFPTYKQTYTDYVLVEKK